MTEDTVWLVEEWMTYKESVPQKVFREKDDAEEYTNRSDKEFVVTELELM